jgi:hypothetical protein
MCIADECCSEKCQNRSLVAVVSIFICFNWVSWWILVGFGFQQFNSVLGIINILVWNGIVLGICVNYYYAINVEAGYVPAGWVRPET